LSRKKIYTEANIPVAAEFSRTRLDAGMKGSGELRDDY
jgi:hypothetical protein